MKCESCSTKIKPVVIFDIDGTLGLYHQHFINFACKYWDIQKPLLPYTGEQTIAHYLNLGLREYREAKLAYRQGGFKRFMPVVPNAVSAVAAVRDAGANVWLATTRPYMRHDSIDPDTRFWLARHAFKYDSLVFGEDKLQQVVNVVGSRRVVAVLDDLLPMVDLARDLFPNAYVRMHRSVSNQAMQPMMANVDINHFADMAIQRTIEWKKRYDR